MTKKSSKQRSKRRKKVKDDDKADKDALEAAAKELTDTIMPIGAKLYEEAAKEDAPAEDAAEADDKKGKKSKKSKADEAVEGEVVDEK
jgi:hypothetical protein